MATNREYAELSSAVYGVADEPEGWKRFADSSQDDGFHGAAFRNRTTGEVVVAFRGTEVTDARDLRADRAILAGQMPAQFADGLAFFRDIAKDVPGPITLTGHSLGGAIAQYVTARAGASSVTFAAPGIMQMSGFSFGPEGNANVRNFVVPTADSISVLGRHVGRVEPILVLPGGLATIGCGSITTVTGAACRAAVVYAFHNMRTYRAYFWFAGADASPIALDLDGDGVETVSLDRGVWFDHAGDRFAERTGWIAPDDGLLVLDRNGNGAIDGGTELFGDSTLLRNGVRAPNGYAALAELDDNRDGRIDARDTAFAKLRIWRDVNGDGLSAPGELNTLATLGIASIDTAFQSGPGVDAQGNDHRQTGAFRRADGRVGVTTDVWFKTDPLESIALDRVAVPERVAALPDLQGFGVVADLHQVMARTQDGALETLVANFAAQSDPADRTRTVEAILARWTDSAGVDAGSRGPYVDATKLAVLEKLFGQPFVGSGGSDPGPGAASWLAVAYQGVAEVTYGQLMAQTHLKSLFDLVTSGWDDARQTLRIDLDAAGMALQREIGADPIAGRADLAEFARSVRGLIPFSTPEYLQFRDRFAADPELTWAMDAAGKTRVVNDVSEFTASAWRGGDGDDVLTGSIGDDALHGGGGQDVLRGGAGADLLDAGSGWDSLSGEDGDDVLLGGADDDTLDGGSGNDVLHGDTGDDVLNGGAGDDVLDGGSGDDRLDGGPGNDVYLLGRGSGIERVVGSGEGHDAIVLKPGVAPEDVIIHTYGGQVFVSITGTADELRFPLSFMAGALQELRFADGRTLDAAAIRAAAARPTEAADELSGGYGNDVIDGLGGDDLLLGGWGDDRLYGGAGRDSIFAGAGSDLLDGGAGADWLSGGPGNDVYVVDDRGDVVTERAGEGTDTVSSSITYTLRPEVENLVLLGTSPIDGTGNAGRNTLTGNTAANVLDGGAGADTMRGGAGNDTYVVDQTSDVVVELPGGGTDTVLSSIAYRLPANVENLTLTGNAAVSGTGNELSNVLTGNVAANVLDGGAGADRMVGGTGDDTFVVDVAGDVVIESPGQGTDTVRSSITYVLGPDVENLALVGTAAINGTGTDGSNVLTGNAAPNVLDGRGGVDTMRGGPGDDTYVVDVAGDVVTELPGEGTDTVRSTVSYRLPAEVERLELTGMNAIDGTGNALGNVLTGNAAANRLDGGPGADRMVGGKGNDTYVMDATGDVVVEQPDEGKDVVVSGVSYALPDNVEDLRLTGTAALSGTGNALANTLTGNDGPNLLDGGAGNDVLTGGKGGDTYVFRRGTGRDVIVEDDATPGSADVVRAAGITARDLTLARRGNDLIVALRGGADEIDVTNWYLGSAYRVELIEAGDGRRLPGGRVDALIQAMASFGASRSLSWNQAVEQRPDEAQVILAQHWQAPAA